jgi:hypothetical protein
MWTLGLLNYPLDEKIDISYKPCPQSFSDEVLNGASKIKAKFNLPGEIKPNFKMQCIEIGNVYLTPEQCLDF